MSLKEILLTLLAVSLGCLLILIIILYFDSEQSRIEQERETHRIAQEILNEAEHKKKLNQVQVDLHEKAVYAEAKQSKSKSSSSSSKYHEVLLETKKPSISSAKVTITSSSSAEVEKVNPKKVFIADKQYPVEKGQTFYMDKGLLKLYVTLDLAGSTLFVNGEEYHNGGQLVDGTIKEEFNFDSESGKFVNKSGTIIISDYDGMQFNIEDKRTGICLPFNGTLTLIE